MMRIAGRHLVRADDTIISHCTQRNQNEQSVDTNTFCALYFKGNGGQQNPMSSCYPAP